MQYKVQQNSCSHPEVCEMSDVSINREDFTQQNNVFLSFFLSALRKNQRHTQIISWSTHTLRLICNFTQQSGREKTEIQIMRSTHLLGTLSFMLSTVYFLSVYHSGVNQHTAPVWVCYTCLLLLASTCFDHSCGHLQGVPQYKCQEYNRNHIKCIVEFSIVLSIIKAV